MEKLVNLKINGIAVSVPSGTTILEAAKKAKINIPTLCHLKHINAIGSCRICLVEVKNGRPPVVAACVYPVAENMEVITNSKKIMDMRKRNLELILSTHTRKCLSCYKSTTCKLQALANEYGCDELAYNGSLPERKIDESHPSLVRDTGKCILCKRCKAVCSQVQTVKAIDVNNRGFESYLGCAFGKDIAQTGCVGCGQCTLVCPCGALTEKNDVEKIIQALNDPEKIVVAAPAPSVRVALGEEFGQPIGTNCEGKLARSLRMIGANYVFDVDYGADMTIVEEANELIERVTNKGVLPMITSCSPGWVNFLTTFYPEFIQNLSTTKSPQNILGSAIKTYWAEKNKIDPKKIFFFTVMPCTAKKTEIIGRDNALDKQNIYDVDATITVREYAHLLKRLSIDFNNLPDDKFDDPLGESTGSAIIFGASGGVMEAAIRTAVDKLSGKSVAHLDYKKVRGFKGIKEASVKVGDTTINVCVASGLGNARQVLENIKSGKKQYHFVEIMACPNGCINGGGMPIHDPDLVDFSTRAKLRAKSLYKDDIQKTIRKSHENKAIITMYKEYFEKPGSHKAHHALHTSYKPKNHI